MDSTVAYLPFDVGDTGSGVEQAQKMDAVLADCLEPRENNETRCHCVLDELLRLTKAIVVGDCDYLDLFLYASLQKGAVIARLVRILRGFLMPEGIIQNGYRHMLRDSEIKIGADGSLTGELRFLKLGKKRHVLGMASLPFTGTLQVR